MRWVKLLFLWVFLFFFNQGIFRERRIFLLLFLSYLMILFCVYRNNNLYNNQAWMETKQQQQHQSDSVISSQTTTTATTANPTKPATTTNIITNINNNTAKQQQKPDNSQPANNRNERMRIFVALFDYDPPTMSPNPDACEEELPFREGQLIKVNVIKCILVGFGYPKSVAIKLFIYKI